MTQNSYQGPPPGYPAQPPQGQYPPPGGAYPAPYPPPGYQQPQYPQAPAQPAYPAQPQAPAGVGDDEFGDPGAPTKGGDAPAAHQLNGRLVMFRPKSFEALAAGYKGGDPKDLAITELIVLDGEPIPGNIDGMTDVMTPFAAGPKFPPFYCGNVYIRGALVPSQLEPYVAGRGFCLARVGRSQASGTGKPSLRLFDPTEQDKALARQILGTPIRAGWERLQKASAPPAPAGAPGYGPPQGGQAVPPPGYSQAPGQAYPGQPYPPAPQGPPPGYGPPPGQYLMDSQGPPPGYATPYAAQNPGHGPYGDGPGPQGPPPGYQAQNPAGAPPEQPQYPRRAADPSWAEGPGPNTYSGQNPYPPGYQPPY